LVNYSYETPLGPMEFPFLNLDLTIYQYNEKKDHLLYKGEDYLCAV